MDADLSSLVGQELVGFRLTAMLGEGGMAAVFRGENLLDPSIVRAIKVVRPELSARREFARRFAEEARILERLNHPNVVRFFGVRRERDWLVMELELLEGRTLAGMLKEWAGQKAPLGSVVSIVRQACEGVAAAHALDVVHRDLKPENLFVAPDGTTRVLDFGIARALDAADRADRVTVQGTVPGSPAYMAPEVCAGAVPTPAADVYALGLTLHEAVLGRHPFDRPGTERRSSTQLMFAQVNEALPSIRDERPEVPERLEKIVARATAKKPEERYATARELGEALAELGVALPAEAKDRPAAPKSLTEFALPEIAPKGRTTAPATLAKRPADEGKGRGPALIIAGALSVGLLGGILYLATKPAGAREERHGAATAIDPSMDHTTATATAAAAAEPPPKNLWVRVEPPQKGGKGEVVHLGIASDSVSASVKGFRPKRGISAPADAFEIQQHEVTWEELDPFLAATPAASFERPAAVPADPAKRARLPATGVPWETALAYCKSLGGATLPSEEQWELAARGEVRRPYAWGPQPIDLMRTHAFAGKSAQVVEVMSSDQDVTPGDQAHSIYDLMGNAREWTADLYRGDLPGDDSWAQEGGLTYRAVRGLPLAAAAKDLPAEGAAYRDALCATGPCPPDTKNLLQWVGFRCARAARAHEGRP